MFGVRSAGWPAATYWSAIGEKSGAKSPIISECRLSVALPSEATVTPGTRTGRSRSVLVPSPSWPYPLSPAAQRVPSLLANTVCCCAPATAITLLATLTGRVIHPLREPAPIVKAPLPTPQSVPSALRNMVCAPPPAIPTTLVAMRMGRFVLVSVWGSALRPLPSWP